MYNNYTNYAYEITHTSPNNNKPINYFLNHNYHNYFLNHIWFNKITEKQQNNNKITDKQIYTISNDNQTNNNQNMEK